MCAEFYCHGKCEEIYIHVHGASQAGYGKGWKQCTICKKWCKTEDAVCQCCHAKFRINGRATHARIPHAEIDSLPIIMRAER